MQQHLYLHTLEVEPLVVGHTYNPLPSHLTLMSRYSSVLHPSEMATAVRPIFEVTNEITLLFGATALIGPKDTAVHLIEPSQGLVELHDKLRTLLGSLNVTFAYPQFMGNGWKPHVSQREDNDYPEGYNHTASAAYLIEVEICGSEHLRTIRNKFSLNGQVSTSM